MNPDYFIFPAPPSSFGSQPLRDVIWIDRDYQSKRSKTKAKSASNGLCCCRSTRNKSYKSKTTDAIPCLFLHYPVGSDKVLIFFHGNSEDIGWTQNFTYQLTFALKVNVISVEYPGYGLYPGAPNAKRVLKDAEIVYDYLHEQIGILPKDILIFGRSIGSGPATYLAARREAAALCLMSPYTSIKAAVKEIAGRAAAFVIKERFKNKEEIQKVKCPVLLIHGKKDVLIPMSHTAELEKRCKGLHETYLSDEMTHNDYNVEEDVVKPLIQLMEKYSIVVKTGDKKYTMPSALYEKPDMPPAKEKSKPFIVRVVGKLMNK